MPGRWLLGALAALALAAPAHAAKLTLGSTLTADATQIEAHGQDTAFWPITVAGKSAAFPEDGQITAVTVKGTVLREKGAADPANLIHFQSLVPEGDSGLTRVWLTSGDFFLPIDQPNAITTFEPENLCVKQGGYLAFNDIGGFEYGGSLTAPLDPAHYHNGAPFQITAPVANAVTARYSAHDQTKNGDVLNPFAGNDQGKPNGSLNRGQELLMRYVLATGDDRSQSCGGPRRHPDGTLVAPKVHQLRVAGNGRQRPYVTKDRRFTVGVYCESPDAPCLGTATLLRNGSALRRVAGLTVPAQTSARIPMRLSRRLFRKLDRQHFLLVDFVLTSEFGTVTTRLDLKR